MGCEGLCGMLTLGVKHHSALICNGCIPDSRLFTDSQTKTVQPKAQGEAGMIVNTESPIHHSNVMAYSKEQSVRSRIGHK
jgi:hypothetical protein